ncbi:hypothetical protein ACFLX2_00750 [Candidatus Dependentiae bacterium]
MKQIVPLFEKELAYELISLHLKDAVAQLSEFSGKNHKQPMHG